MRLVQLEEMAGVDVQTCLRSLDYIVALENTLLKDGFEQSQFISKVPFDAVALGFSLTPLAAAFQEFLFQSTVQLPAILSDSPALFFFPDIHDSLAVFPVISLPHFHQHFLQIWKVDSIVAFGKAVARFITDAAT